MRRGPQIARISELEDRTSEDEASGAMRSVQAADVTLPEAELRKLWTPSSLERLARTYWRYLTHATFGLVRVLYSEHERIVVLLWRPLKLLTFDAPEYEMDGEGGLVRWKIKRGLLVARSGRGGHGHLQIDVRRLAEDRQEGARLHVEVEVANFHPAVATRLGKRVYNATQSRIHVFVTNGFLRSLTRLDLAESRVRRFDSPAHAGESPEGGPTSDRPPMPEPLPSRNPTADPGTHSEPPSQPQDL